MTSTLTPPGAAGTERNPRMPLVSADLLPAEIVHARQARKVRRGVLTGLACFAVVLIAWCGVATLQTHRVRNDLAAGQEQAATLRAKQQAYTEVITVQAQSAAIDARLAELMAKDLQWSALLTAVQQLAPHGVQLTAITGNLPTEATGASSATVTLPNTTGEDVIGKLTVAGTGTSKALIAGYVDALARLAGLGNPVLSGVTWADNTLQFTANLDITASMLGGRYTSKGGAH
jgi:Tfp pilus assembly protein PilN